MSDYIKVGMVGGGAQSFIGAVHRMAFALDGHYQLVCGAFSRSSEVSRQTGASLNLDPNRVYPDWHTMLLREQVLPPSERMQVVIIVTPNATHIEIATAALEAGFHVMSDKPATCTLAEGQMLDEAVKRSGCLYGLSHTYLGYPMIKEARELVVSGVIGPVRKILVQYLQGWLSEKIEDQGNKQAAWRVDPVQSGPAGALLDIGTHAQVLVEYVTGDHISDVCADLTAFVEGRQLDDDGSILFRTGKGAKGVLTASQVCHGEDNNLTIAIYGEKGGLFWQQEHPESLWLKRQDQADVRITKGSSDISATAQRAARLPGGHPEGYLEALANIYAAFAHAVRSKDNMVARSDLHHGGSPANHNYPDMATGLSALRFVDAVLKNMDADEKWTRVMTET